MRQRDSPRFMARNVGSCSTYCMLYYSVLQNVMDFPDTVLYFPDTVLYCLVVSRLAWVQPPPLNICYVMSVSPLVHLTAITTFIVNTFL